MNRFHRTVGWVGAAALALSGALGASAPADAHAAPAPARHDGHQAAHFPGHGSWTGHHRRSHRPLNYVALGDSYTAAPYVPTTSLDDGCLRSDHNYPSLLAQAVHAATFTDASCSGAATKDMTTSQLPGVAPQFDALSSSTNLVTVSIGGNDFSVFGTLVGYCPTLRASDPTGDPCRQAETLPDGSNALFDDIPQIAQRVTTVLQQVHQLAPNARVLVIGYPQIVPSHGTCPALLPLADGDYRYGLQLGRALNGALEYAAWRTHSTYVDVARASQGHDICSADPWINGQTTDPTRALAFHPFAVEQAAVAQLAERALTRW